MHKLHQTIKTVNKTHKGLGAMIAMNLLAAKAKMCILNISPAGCGKSTVTDATTQAIGRDSKKFTSLTLASLHRLKGEFNDFGGHVVIDDLGGEKSQWSRVATITVLANLVYTHFVDKLTMSYRITIENFQGSTALNIQPVLMETLVMDDDWIAVVRGKVLRYYHLFRPLQPVQEHPKLDVDWSIPIQDVEKPTYKGKLYWQLVAIGLTQFDHARVIEHIPALLRGCAALDGRHQVETQDYNLLIKLLRPMQLERYIIESYGWETSRHFNNNAFCIMVEIATHKQPSLEIICEDYKVSPSTAERLIAEAADWCFLKKNSAKRVYPTPKTQTILDLIGVNQTW